MKLRRISWLMPLVIILIIGGFIMPGCETDPGIDDGVEEPPDPSTAFEGFYGVCPELEAELEQIVLADPAVQAVIEGKDYSFTVDGHTIEGQDYNLAVGVRLKESTTPDEFKA